MVAGTHVSRPDRLAVVLLILLASRHYMWLWAPAGHMGEGSKALGAVAALALLALLWVEAKPTGRVLAFVFALYAWHELQVALCATWFIFDPWPLAQDQPMCSGRIGFDLGAVGLLGIAIAASAIITQCRDHHEPIA